MSTLKRISLEQVQEHYGGGFTVEPIDGGYSLTTSGWVVSFGRQSAERRIYLTLPDGLTPSETGGALWPFEGQQMVYGKKQTLAIAAQVMHKEYGDRNIAQMNFGLLPGAFYFRNGEPHFEAALDPLAEGANNLLFWTDHPLNGYAGPNGLTALNFGNCGIYGLVLPFNYLCSVNEYKFGTSVMALREEMHLLWDMHCKMMGALNKARQLVADDQAGA